MFEQKGKRKEQLGFFSSKKKIGFEDLSDLPIADRGILMIVGIVRLFCNRFFQWRNFFH